MSKNNFVEPFKGKDGYMYVALVKNGIEHVHPVHMLVWETFKGKVPEGYVVKHKNSNKSDNSIENLELVKKEENDIMSPIKRYMDDWNLLDDDGKQIVRPILIYYIKELNKRIKELGIV